MDDDLRRELWNVIYNYLLHNWDASFVPELYRYVAARLWMDLLKKPIDVMPSAGTTLIGIIREIYFDDRWYLVYDLVEFFCQHSRGLFQDGGERFIDACNDALKKEMSAWRVVGRHVARITSEEEIAAIEEAERLADKFAPVSVHIRDAVAKLADRKNPDYRNSIKESILAVEAVCRITTGEQTLGKALKALPQKGVIVDPAIEGAFHKLYGYTNGPQGIRHALLDQGSLDHDDAKFMLVACSAFVNLVRARAG